MSKGEFDVALGARVISKEAGGRIQVNGLFFGENYDGDDDHLPRVMSKEAEKRIQVALLHCDMIF